jgi:segregation and condensation protein B
VAHGLVQESGRLETAGRPILYTTTFDFLQNFGLQSVEDLPPLEEQVEQVLEATLGPTEGAEEQAEQKQNLERGR